MSAELLNKFVAVSDVRGYLREPFVLGDFVYATNGHVAIRLPRARLASAPEANASVEKIGDTFEKAVRTDFVDMPELPEIVACRHCGGSGMQVECDDCDGEGEFDHGRHTYECQECRGSGQVNRLGGIKRPCIECDGTGGKRHQAVSIGCASYDRRYLAKILELPGLKFSPATYPAAAYFTFDGGEGLLMPMWVN